jgi:hypothetical protein
MADNVTKDTSLESTKQMLDELDALMERMLSMPMNEPEELAAVPKEISKGPSLAASLSLLEQIPAEPERAVAPPPAPPPPAVPSAPKKPLERRGKSKRSPHAPVKPPHINRYPPLTSRPLLDDEPAIPVLDDGAFDEAALPPAIPQPEPLTNELLPRTMMPALDPLLARVPDVPVRSAPFSLLAAITWILCGPLIWINQAFDGATMYFGVAGGWMRGQGGRTVLGFSGIALFLVAASWILKDWLGWNW